MLTNADILIMRRKMLNAGRAKVGWCWLERKESRNLQFPLFADESAGWPQPFLRQLSFDLKYFKYFKYYHQLWRQLCFGLKSSGSNTSNTFKSIPTDYFKNFLQA